VRLAQALADVLAERWRKKRAGGWNRRRRRRRRWRRRGELNRSAV
jgi:hypothetical protein